MNTSVQTIPVLNLALAFLPVAVVIFFMFRWSLRAWTGLYALGRMLLQLVLIGYVLVYIFETDHSWLVVAVLGVMLFASSWIALHPLRQKRSRIYPKVLASIALGGCFSLVTVTQGVLALDPWFMPQYMIPLAGMIFANCMNAVSLAAERLEGELGKNVVYPEARRVALRASLIPLINMMFAVGVVSLPGMMTGQILSGVSPLVAVRYQIMVMCMVFGAAGISAVCYLVLVRPRA